MVMMNSPMKYMGTLTFIFFLSFYILLFNNYIVKRLSYISISII